MKPWFKNRKAFTLIELLLAVSLLGMIMVVAANIDIASRNFYFRTDRQGQLQLRLSVAMEHMARNISQAHGDASSSGINVIGANSINVREDIPASPENYADDTWVSYWQSGNQILFCPNGTVGACLGVTQTLATSNVTNLQFIPHFAAPSANLEIVITGTDALENPPVTVTLHSVVYPRSSSSN